MVVVKTVAEFVAQNDTELRKFLAYKTGIIDRHMVEDTLQEFYTRLIQTKALQSFDENQGSFDTYIVNLFCWMLPFLSRKNFRHKHAVVPVSSRHYYEDPVENVDSGKKVTYDYRIISYVRKHGDRMLLEMDDVFNYVSDDTGSFRVNGGYDTSLCDSETNPLSTHYVEEFKEYIRRTESSKTAERMILFVDQKCAGCSSVEIADMMRVSYNMVTIIRQSLQKKYTRWQKKSKVI